MPTKQDTPAVYGAIAAVQADIAKHGIGKDGNNTFDRYAYHTIDGVRKALAPLLAEHGLVILPRVTARHEEQRDTKSGGSQSYVALTIDYDFVATADGSTHTVTYVGEGMDRGDKATSKAGSAAWKYMCITTFCIATEGEEDADASSPEASAKTLAPALPTPYPEADFPKVIAAVEGGKVASMEATSAVAAKKGHVFTIDQHMALVGAFAARAKASAKTDATTTPAA